VHHIVAFSKRAGTAFALTSFVLLVLSTTGTSGLSAWTETAADFNAGQNTNTRVENDGLVLMNKPLPTDAWSNRSYLLTPTPRYQQSMAYDSVNGVHLIYGGYYSDGLLNDVWAYNITADNWTARPNVRDPSEIQGHINGQAMAFDDRNGVAVMFGGFNSWMQSWGHYYWTFLFNATANQWNETSSPDEINGRAYHSMVYDSQTGCVILFGGEAYNGDMYHSGRFVCFNDTWSFDVVNRTWTNKTSQNAPSPRHSQSMCYDPATGLLIMFGGRNDTDIFQDTWTYNPVTNTWTQTNPSVLPPARYGAAMAMNPSGGSVILFGGQGTTTMYNDTWSYNATTNTWKRASAESGPLPRCYPTMTCDSDAGRLFLFAGREQSGAFMADYWAYDPVNNTWAMLGTPASPLPRVLPSIAYDRANRVGILFGGWFGGAYETNDTWAYDALNDNWTEMRPQSPPPIRNGAAMCYDQARGTMVLFGGETGQGPTNDTWTYDLSTNTWTNRMPSNPPPRAVSCQMAYDPIEDLVVLFGVGINQDSYLRNETWTYDPGDNAWTNRTRPVAPPATEYSGLVYDEANNVIIRFGFVWETWTYHVSTSTWTRVPPDNFPSGWTGMTAAYKTGYNVTLFFGYGESADAYTWQYDLKANSWNISYLNISPPPVSGVMYFDSELNCAVFVGDGLYDVWIYGLTDRYDSGTYMSPPKDTGGHPVFGLIEIAASTLAGTDVMVQIRTGWNLADLYSNQFIGPDGTAGSWFGPGKHEIPPMFDGNQLVQYRARLTTAKPAVTPTLISVTINYNLRQSLAMTSPTGADNWTASDPDNDTLSFDIYLENGTSSALLVSDLPNETGSWPWDTSSIPNGTYSIRICAVDNNPSIPLTVNATSGNFTIYHPPPPDHPPMVTLLSPRNNSIIDSTSVRLSWAGTDPDGDPLTFKVLYSDRPLGNGTVIVKQTAAIYLDVDNLSDNTTYFWTVDAGDGTNIHTDIPTDIWTFTVRIPAVNNTPRITSFPPTTVRAGETYTYNVTAIDEDGDILTYYLVESPPTMSIGPLSGRCRWTPNDAQVGNHNVTVRVYDGMGGLDEQTFTITVLAKPSPEKPRCAITSPANNSKVSGRVVVHGTALNGSLPITIVQVRIDGGAWQTAIGIGNWSLSVDFAKSPNGRHRIEARAFDGSLYSDPVSIDLDVRNPEPKVTVAADTWYLILLGALLAAFAGVYLSVWKKRL
jgi:hypothetical protein